MYRIYEKEYISSRITNLSISCESEEAGNPTLIATRIHDCQPDC